MQMDAGVFNSMQKDAEFFNSMYKWMLSFYFNTNGCWVFTSMQKDAEFLIQLKSMLGFLLQCKRMLSFYFNWLMRILFAWVTYAH